MVEATLFTDPACPWAYSANPALRVLEWRYGDGLRWRLVTIVLREEPNPRYDAARYANGWATFARLYGMPFTIAPKERGAGTGRGCRAIVAARVLHPGSEWRVLRALALANFTTSLLLDDDDRIREALRNVPGIDGNALVARLDDPDVEAAYNSDKAEARSAAGTPAEIQGKTATADGLVRYTAPTVVFQRDGRQLVAGGWQPMLAYDVLLAHLAPELERTPPPDSVGPLFDRFPDGLTTSEVAALLAPGPDYVSDLNQAERQLIEAAAAGGLIRTPCGNDAVWHAPASHARAA